MISLLSVSPVARSAAGMNEGDHPNRVAVETLEDQAIGKPSDTHPTVTAALDRMGLRVCINAING